MEFERYGSGRPLLLVHGLGGSRRSWDSIASALATQRELIVVDLPGFGDTPPLPNVSIASLADAVTAFLTEQRLGAIDAVGSSMGARLVLELARRGAVGDVVSLDPGGFWEGWETDVFQTSVDLSYKLVCALQPVLPVLTANPLTRTLLMAQFSAHPWTLPASVVLTELRSFARGPSFEALLADLARGPRQQGAEATPGRVTLGWGRRDYVCFPPQARRALRAFPAARLHWFENCGHFPHWDSPGETVRLILESTG
jgi:pimeloyl-ACP methyl ester carboxylesterase